MQPTGQTTQRNGSTGGKHLSVIAGTDRNLHLSPILRQIRDEGPALPQGATRPSPRAIPVLEPLPSLPAPAVAQAAGPPRALVFMASGVLLLTLLLAGSTWLLYRQEQRLQVLEEILQQ